MNIFYCTAVCALAILFAVCSRDNHDAGEGFVSANNSVSVSTPGGKSKTQLAFTKGDGLALYSANDCNLDNYARCSIGAFNRVDGEIIAPAPNPPMPKANYLSGEKQQASVLLRAPSNPGFSGRVNHRLVTWKDRVWLIAGHAKEGDKNDVWSSADGAHWQLEVVSAAFSPRAAHQVVVFKNRLWLIGGSSHGKILNDVWSSADGVHWISETVSASFSPRAYHQVVVYQDRLWLVGGRIGKLANENGQLVGMSNDVWSSTNGIDWIQQVAEAGFLPRMNHHLLAFRNKLWVMGGFNMSDFAEIWSSQDGIDWVEETTRGEFGFRNFSALTIHNDQLWLVAGSTLDKSQGGDSASKNDVWTSIDGIHWQEKTAKAEFKARWGLQAVSFKQKMLVIGGDIGTGAKGVPIQAQNDIWSSVNGADWHLEIAGHSNRR